VKVSPFSAEVRPPMKLFPCNCILTLGRRLRLGNLKSKPLGRRLYKLNDRIERTA
jgi:hypothetical protein